MNCSRTFHGRPSSGGWRRSRRFPNPRARRAGPSDYIGKAPPIINLQRATLDWGPYWIAVKHELARLGYAFGTARMYHRILCAFGTHIKRHHHRFARPGRVTADMVRSFVHSLTDRQSSWSWISSNISALRTMFDKFGGLSVTDDLVTPKRPARLPHILSESEAERLIAAARSLRDQLLLGLMYRCGLKVGEVCALRWCDVHLSQSAIRIAYARNTMARAVPIPEQFRDLLQAGLEQCPKADYIFRGKRAGEHLSPRMVHLILARALAGADIPKPVTCMTLRHSFAVAALRGGMNIRQLQEYLGHASIETTMLYEHCTPPADIPNPLTAINPASLPSSSSPPIVAQASRLCPPLEGEPAVSLSPVPNLPPPSPSALPFPSDQASLAGQFHGTFRLGLRNAFLAVRTPSMRPPREPTEEALWVALSDRLARAGPT